MVPTTPVSRITTSFYAQPAGLSSAIVGTAENPLDLVRLRPLMELSSGRAETTIALIDGPVATNLADLSTSRIREIPGKVAGTCAQADNVACMHGTLVAGILCARRGSAAPAICPNCTLLVRPIFAEVTSANGQMPSATPEELAAAIVDCVDEGAQLVNLSAALADTSLKGERRLDQALDYCGQRGVIVVAAAGNQGTVGSSSITRHPWVIPVVACDLRGRPIGYSNLGNSIGRRGLSAPGAGITSLGPDGKQRTFGGTSAAAPFVTGALALLRSEFPNASAAKVKFALMQGDTFRKATIVPALLDAWAAYRILQRTRG